MIILIQNVTQEVNVESESKIKGAKTALAQITIVNPGISFFAFNRPPEAFFRVSSLLDLDQHDLFYRVFHAHYVIAELNGLR